MALIYDRRGAEFWVWDVDLLDWTRGTQPSGSAGGPSSSVEVTNFPATQAVSDGGGSLTVDGPLTDTQLRASAVPVSPSLAANVTASRTFTAGGQTLSIAVPAGYNSVIGTFTGWPAGSGTSFFYEIDSVFHDTVLMFDSDSGTITGPRTIILSALAPNFIPTSDFRMAFPVVSGQTLTLTCNTTAVSVGVELQASVSEGAQFPATKYDFEDVLTSVTGQGILVKGSENFSLDQLNLTNSNPLTVAIVDANGSQVAGALESGHLATIDTSTAKIPVGDAETTGTIAALNATVTHVVPGGHGAAIVAVSGSTWSGVEATFQGTADGTNWFTLYGTDSGSPASSSTSMSGAGLRIITGIGGLEQIRVSATSYISGSATVTIRTAIAAPGMIYVAGGATEASLALVRAKTDNLDVALSTRLKAADTLTGVTTVGTITNTVGVGAKATAADPTYTEAAVSAISQDLSGRVRTLGYALVSDTPQSYIDGDVRALSLTTDGRIRTVTTEANTWMNLFDYDLGSSPSTDPQSAHVTFTNDLFGF